MEDTSNNLNAEEVSKLNLKLKSQFAGEFIQMMTEVKVNLVWCVFLLLGNGDKMLYAMHS